MLTELIGMAFDSLRANKFRSLLTMLGVIIGAGTLVAVLSLGNALQGQVFEQFVDLGTRRIAVTPGDPRAKGARDVPGYGLLSLQDYQVLNTLVSNHPDIFRAIAPEITVNTRVRAGAVSLQTLLVGTSADYPQVQRTPMLHGRFLTPADEAEGARVGVLGWLVARDLFGADKAALRDVIGQTVEINGQPIEIVGIINENGGPFSTDSRIFTPVSTMRLRLIGDLDLPGRGLRMSSILLGLQSEKQVNEAVALIERTLRAARNVPDGAINDFNLQTPTQALNVLAGISTAITGFIAVVAGISLVVGGIGIMNIMLVAVTERTREIGVRKALGASDGDVLGQFVMEAVALSLVGSLIGVIGAIGIVWLISTFSGINTGISWIGIILALTFASAIGVGFGYYPARRAALLPPIEALRYE
ncbi:ABC transporter permease [Chloroflexus sp. MS-CIW-1]|jgi:putative ABC transport system permease protein|uniref:ABC transporter permease n=1 Tax=Chloroflexus sp. MS-CIW-1 TaxID=3055768 RepID=UPI002649B636|nr:ABC transporter permease [Chloroflexus sp. MS-CIW-1]MDN5270504.1 ABC transporter permease [Chloroflexus sp. MS-CIW-1]